MLTFVEGLDEPAPDGSHNARIKALAVVAHPTLGLLAEPRVLQVTQALPATLVANAIAVQEANREYQERALGREGLRRMYIGTLTLSLFLAVFGAVLLAVILGNQLARPLLLLAAGVREVAAGDLSPKPALQGKDELGGLTRSFAEMTQQLADARAAVDKSMGQVSAARAHLQTILDNLTAGVIVLDAQGNIQTSNPGATRILRVPLAAYEGRPLASVEGLEAFGAAVQQQFDEYMDERRQHGLDHWQQSFELNAAQPGSPPHAVTLVARGAEMPAEAPGKAARLLVFDDISEIVSAQRAQAWGEVARRLAHEIKNPLTPIQLSAERLEMKLAGKVGPTEQAIVTKSVQTIVDQVDAMKRLVNEFRDYARLPAAELKPVDLNALVSDVLQLYAREGDAARCADPCAGAHGARLPLPEDHGRRPAAAAGAAQPVAKRPGRHRRRAGARSHRADPVERNRPPGPPDRAGHGQRLPRPHPQAGIRAVRHHQGQGHGPGPGGGQEDRRRARRPRGPEKSRGRRAHPGSPSIVIIRGCGIATAHSGPSSAESRPPLGEDPEPQELNGKHTGGRRRAGYPGLALGNSQ